MQSATSLPQYGHVLGFAALFFSARRRMPIVDGFQVWSSNKASKSFAVFLPAFATYRIDPWICPVQKVSCHATFCRAASLHFLLSFIATTFGNGNRGQRPVRDVALFLSVSPARGFDRFCVGKASAVTRPLAMQVHGADMSDNAGCRASTVDCGTGKNCEATIPVKP